MLRFAKRIWVLLVILLVVVIAVFVVDRFRGFFGHTVLTKPGAGLVNDPEPFNPKVVKYEIFGSSGATANINYWDADANTHQINAAPLPWTVTISTTLPSVSANIMAQSDGSQVGCRITVDNIVKEEKNSDGVNPQTFCLVKSA
jgi:Mycobacterium membrane protein